MAIDTAPKRNTALIETYGILIPDATISSVDMGTMLGWYVIACYGPLRFAAGAIYRAGAQAAGIYRPGVQAGK